MTSVKVKRRKLTIEVRTSTGSCALESRLDIPLEHVRSASIDPTLVRDMPCLSDLPLPGLFRLGVLQGPGDLVFWEVQDPEKAVVIAISNGRQARLIVQVDDPPRVVSRINAAVRPAAP
jgi:hypothetical protein